MEKNVYMQNKRAITIKHFIDIPIRLFYPLMIFLF